MQGAEEIMEHHYRLIVQILNYEELRGFEKEQRRDELDQLDTESLERITQIYQDESTELR
jgi:hypothetical protein